jgi:hypothetical protein
MTTQLVGGRILDKEEMVLGKKIMSCVVFERWELPMKH